VIPARCFVVGESSIYLVFVAAQTFSPTSDRDLGMPKPIGVVPTDTYESGSALPLARQFVGCFGLLILQPEFCGKGFASPPLLKWYPFDVSLRIVTVLVFKDEIMQWGRSGADFSEKLFEGEVTVDTPASVDVVIGSVGIVATAAHGMPHLVFRSRVAVRGASDRVFLVHAALPWLTPAIVADGHDDIVVSHVRNLPLVGPLSGNSPEQVSESTDFSAMCSWQRMSKADGWAERQTGVGIDSERMVGSLETGRTGRALNGNMYVQSPSVSSAVWFLALSTLGIMLELFQIERAAMKAVFIVRSWNGSPD